MILKNWYKALLALVAYDTTTKFTNYAGAEVTFNGNSASDAAAALQFGCDNTGDYQAALKKAITTTTWKTAGVAFGTGTAEPSFEDYYLSGDLITGFSYTSVLTKEFDETGCTLTSVFTITNTSGADFTISEVGLFGAKTTASSSASYRFMVEHTLLETPVTIPAGAVGQVTYSIRIDIPTA